MLPIFLYLMFGIIAVVIFILIQLALLIFTKGRTVLHDKLAQTVTVDMASQMIFDTTDDLVAYKNKLQAENAEKAAY